MAPGGLDWLAKTPEETLEPEIPICDPHHHFWISRPEPLITSSTCCRNSPPTSAAATTSARRCSSKYGANTVRTGPKS